MSRRSTTIKGWLSLVSAAESARGIVRTKAAREATARALRG